MKPRVLIVDDEPKMARSLAIALRRDGYACHTANHGEAALEVVAEHGADLVVTDRRMPGMDGLALMRRLRADDPDLPVILMTAYGDVPSAVAAMREGAFDYLTKPFDHDELRGRAARAIALRRLQTENRGLRRALARRSHRALVATSPAMKTVLDLVDRVAPSDAAVLIQGESGTGKELIARRLHAHGDHPTGPFVAVNVKAFAPGVLESELFGHEAGAFTDARHARAGCFERADGGTLFLDEIGEIDTGVQAKLLRVVQEGEVQRVGGDAPVNVDVRVVAATHHDVRARIAQGAFREDLFYRLNVIPVRLPPLRERPEDVLPLAEHFLRRHADQPEDALSLTEDAAAMLCAQRWPGNVRELENAIARAVVLARGPAIEVEDLLMDQGAGVDRQGKRGDGTLQSHLDRAAAEHIRAALDAHDGARAEAARALGIDRTTLFRWTKRLGV